MLENLSLSMLFKNDMAPIDDVHINTIKTAIFPEIKIYSSPSENLTRLDNKIATLDVEQERFAKNVPDGHYMITGIPGSGKTVVLLSRAVHLAKSNPNWKILIVTYNKSLRSQLEAKLNNIKDEMDYHDISLENIEIKTFHKIATEHSSLSPGDYKNNSEEFWRDILPDDARENCRPKYDAILIDEYQDFYINWYHFLLKLLIQHEDLEGKKIVNLFLAGDRLQSIYNPNEINWKQDIGLDMRGRSKLLKTSYRTTKEHIQLGISLLLRDTDYRKEVEKFYEDAQDIILKNMTEDSIELLESDYGYLTKRIESLIDEGYNYGDILLIAPTYKTLYKIESFLPEEIRNNTVISKDITDGERMKFTTYLSSKGIESKIAIAVDIDQIEEKKLLYVASTRASHKLILHSKDFYATETSRYVYEEIQQMKRI